MKNEINLLPKKQVRSARDTKEIKILRYLTLGSLVLISCLSVGAFLVTALSPLPALKKEEEQKSREFDTYRTKTAKYVLTQGRLSDISKALGSRIAYGKVLEDMTSETIEGLTYTAVAFSTKSVDLTVSSPSLSVIKAYIDSMKAKNDQKLFNNISISDLEYLRDFNTYSVTVSVTI